jgi:hypothetical protein
VAAVGDFNHRSIRSAALPALGEWIRTVSSAMPRNRQQRGRLHAAVNGDAQGLQRRAQRHRQRRRRPRPAELLRCLEESSVAIIVAVAPSLLAAKEHRSREVTREFQREHPCPSTGKTSGALHMGKRRARVVRKAPVLCGAARQSFGLFFSSESGELERPTL